jgi:hypothetical protein
VVLVIKNTRFVFNRRYYLRAATGTGKEDAWCILGVSLVLWVYHEKGGNTGNPKPLNTYRSDTPVGEGKLEHECCTVTTTPTLSHKGNMAVQQKELYPCAYCTFCVRGRGQISEIRVRDEAGGVKVLVIYLCIYLSVNYFCIYSFIYLLIYYKFCQSIQVQLANRIQNLWGEINGIYP